MDKNKFKYKNKIREQFSKKNKLFSDSPNITNKDDNNRVANEGSEATLRCRSQSNPESTTSWFDPHGQKLINGEGKVSIVYRTLSGNDVIGITTESELRISNVQPFADYGNYICRVVNAEGEDSFAVNLNGTSKFFLVDMNFTNFSQN